MHWLIISGLIILSVNVAQGRPQEGNLTQEGNQTQEGRGFSIPTFGVKLPFPTDPAGFFKWVLAVGKANLKNLADGCVPPHLFLGMTLLPSFKWANGTAIFTGPFFGSAIVGLCVRPTPDKKSIEVVLRTYDFTMSNVDASVIVEFNRPGPPPADGALITANPAKIMKKFTDEILNPISLMLKAPKALSDPLSFGKEFLSVFFPASVSLNMNIKIQPGFLPGIISPRLSKETLTNKNVVSLTAVDVATFPPNDLGFATKDNIEMVDSFKKTIVLIEKFTTLITHFYDEAICESAAMAGKIAFNTIKDIFDKSGRNAKGEPQFPLKPPGK